MKTEGIKTWQDRTYEDPTLIEEDAKADEIRELRAILKERDAEIEAALAANLDIAHTCHESAVKIIAHRAVMQQAQDFLYRVSHWEEGKPDLHDIKTALKEALK